MNIPKAFSAYPKKKDLLNMQKEPLNTNKIREASKAFHESMVEQYESKQPFFDAQNLDRVKNIRADLAQKAGRQRLLDIGCGTGLILNQAHDLFDEIVGVDISDDMMAKIPQYPNVTMNIAPAEAIPFSDQHFNVVTSYSLLQHVFDLSAVFREVRRVLKPGGVYYSDESQNAACFNSLLKLNPDLCEGALRREVVSAQKNTDSYREAFGIDKEMIEMGMYQFYKAGGLVYEEVERELYNVGFQNVQMIPRWYLAQGVVRREKGPDTEMAVDELLQKLLPVSLPLFKYISFFAWA